MNVSSEGAIDLTNVKYVAASEADSDDRLIRAGEVLFNNTNSPELVGKTALYGLPEPRAFSNHMTRVRCWSTALDAAYCAMFLHHKWRDGYFVSVCNNHVSQASVGREVLGNTTILLPPISEQKRIVAKVEQVLVRVNAVRERLAKIPKILKHFRQSVLAAACSGKLTADWRAMHVDVEDSSVLVRRIRQERRTGIESRSRSKTYVEPEAPSTLPEAELPDTWRYVRWEEVGFCQNGTAFPSKEYTSDGIRLLRPGNLHVSGRLLWTQDNTRYLPNRFAEEDANYLIGPNEIVMNLTAQSLKDEFLGRVCLTGQGERCLLNQRIARITPVVLLPEYCHYVFKSPLFRKYVNGLNTGSLIQHMFTTQVLDFVLPLPPLAEQVEIVTRVGALLQLADKVDHSAILAARRVESLTQAVLAKAFRGELVPTEAELAEAECRDYETAEELLERIRRERASLEPPAKHLPCKRKRSGAVAVLPAPLTKPNGVAARHATNGEVERTAKQSRPTSHANVLKDASPDDTMIVVRGTFADGAPRDREPAIRELAGALGFERVGQRIRDEASSLLRTAVRRGILKNDDGQYSLLAKGGADYTREHLIDALRSSINGIWSDRDEAIRATAHHLGFRRASPTFQTAMRSAINGAIRRGLLESNGPEIRKARN